MLKVVSGLLLGAVLTLTGAANAEEAGVIRLGAAVSLTGKYSSNGAFTRNGYDLAVKRINEEGGVTVDGKPYMLEIVYYDDESTPARGAQLVERLIQQDGVKYLLGPYSSGLTEAIAPVTEKYGVPMVEANGAAVSLFRKGYRYLFAVLSTTDQYLRGAVDLAAKVNEDPSSLRVAMAFENDPFSQDVREGVMEDTAKYGMKVVIDDKLPPELNDMSATLTKAKVLKPDLLLVSGHDKGAALTVRQLADQRVDVPMTAITHCDSAQIAEKFGAAAEYTLCAAQWASTLKYEDELFGSASDYAVHYEETYGHAAPYQAAESSAAVQVFADAFERAGSLDPEAVRDALSQTDMMTFYGPIKFDETGKNVSKPTVLFQVQDGKYVVVYPQEFAEAEFRWPTPAWSER
ncbi:amino acid ABC transporter substrate-binding protein [Parvibaculum sp.]|uniref:amino acid ABC transporter substrate-binding protein n=1 Tax=Parvibaculum sp. TaxID=2024848 RepID=UPI000ED8EBEF|nr:amino acid ABC transporter substrate-binding protein [Parvibaculum sp.]MBO6667969.1 amino acid ABC transporter substrate-binding protein [Parvibaculum sp.]MBO6690582.1 amino acid ABC transporter substrate-binding protein [Parvibaculum sp.]MBO6714795.1 amino acid ABC transporter substrate-binding protein [Parvibaculum sp.]HAC60168.1 amino acid ABC transporter substrate-binding protein [Rhodobiaceae bacterium]